MFWIIVTLLIALGIGVPIIQSVYTGFTNSTSGAFVTGNLTPTEPLVTPFESGLWGFMGIIIALIIIGFLFSIIGGKFSGGKSA